MATKNNSDKTGITLDWAVKELRTYVEDANSFLASDLEGDWDLAERYYQGETDMPLVAGRSNVVKTEVRDAIRNTLPSVMRVLLQSKKIVEYFPSSIQHAAWVEQQSEYVTQLFFASDGYNQLYSAVLEALKLKIGPMKAFWEPDPRPELLHFTKVPYSVVEEAIQDPLFEVDTVDLVESDKGDETSETLYNLIGYRLHENGKIRIEATPNYEFFISGNVSSIETAFRQGVHGQRSIVTVSDALDMGLEYDDWLELDAEDPESSDFSSSSTARRGYNKDDNMDMPSSDLLRHTFLLTECYVEYDLRNTGRPQRYRFWLGGSSYQYIDHEEVGSSPFSLIIPMPIPHTVYGHSIPDLTIKEQDTSTSLLRALVDNAHASNTVRIAADPNKTNFDDLMNPALNAPIRKRAGDTLQVMQIPFTGQGNLASLQYLDQDVQNKVGVTKAAQGLDPDAMQSTDKNAVMNTIATSQGQTELMVRNIIETGLIPLFRNLLRLSMEHQTPVQMMKTKGKFIPVNTAMFDPDAIATPNIGLGTASPQQKLAALSMVYQEQKEYIQTLGPNNPFTSYAQMYNTLEDIMEANNIYNVQRYFNVVTPDAEKAWAEQQQKAQQQQMEAAKAAQPIDPSKAYINVEQGKQKVSLAKIAADSADTNNKLRLDAIVKEEELDLKRDEMVYKQSVELAKLNKEILLSPIEKKQAENETISSSTNRSSKKIAAE